LEGTWAAWRGTPDEVGCDPCPAGRVCLAKTGNLSQTTPCPEGHICGEATTPKTQTSHACLEGFYCGSATTPDTMYYYLCIPGFYCGNQTTDANRRKFRCPTGFYCPKGTGFRRDLERPLMPGDAYIRKREFHTAQVASIYCLRQAHIDKMNELESRNEALRRMELPPTTPEVEREIKGGWTLKVLNCTITQLNLVGKLSAVVPVIESVASELIKDDTDECAKELPNRGYECNERFHPESLITLLKDKDPSSYTNKCDKALVKSADSTQNTFVERLELRRNADPENKCYKSTPILICPPTTLDCLCDKSPSGDDWRSTLISCLVEKRGGEKPSSYLWASPDPLNCGDPPYCYDVALYDQQLEDDFDKIGTLFVDYVKRALEREVRNKYRVGQVSRTRCPFGTITPNDGMDSLRMPVPDNADSTEPTSTCIKRKLLEGIGEDYDTIIGRVNPISLDLSNVNYTKAFLSDDISQNRYVFDLPTRSYAVITLDFRHIPKGVVYGRDWRLAIMVDDELDPMHNDSSLCEYLSKPPAASKRAKNLPDVQFDSLAENGCTTMKMPTAFSLDLGDREVPKEEMWSKNSAMAFYLFAYKSVQFRVELQILNGVYLPDRFQMLGCASVEWSQANRINFGTSDTYVIEIRQTMELELPFNMPLKRIQTDMRVVEQVILTKAFINYLPTEPTPLFNSMRHPVAPGEFVFAVKDMYFQTNESTWLAHLPYFSNCRGFGRTTPLTAALEHGKDCTQVDPSQTRAIAELDGGASPQGDQCYSRETNQGVMLRCMLDEVPNNKMPMARWFEARKDSIMFYISRIPFSNDQFLEGIKLGYEIDIQNSLPVFLRRGVPSGNLPGTVIIVMEYWQKTPKMKILVRAQMYFLNEVEPDEEQRKGRDKFEYDLQIAWLGLSHTEVFVNYAFPNSFYMLFYIAIGGISICMILFYWFYHRLFTKIRFPPKFTDSRYVMFLIPPAVRGMLYVIVPLVPLLMLVMMALNGEVPIVGTQLNFWPKAQEKTPDNPNPICFQDLCNCPKGLFDEYQSSWNGETAVTRTCMAERRYGRSGVVLMAIGGYAVMLSLQLFVRANNSRFYMVDPKKAEREARAKAEAEAAGEEDDDEEEEEEEEEDPIFTTIIWKRSTLAFLMFMNCLWLTLLLQFSYSPYFGKYIYYLIVGMYLCSVWVDMLFGNFMGEALLIVSDQLPHPHPLYYCDVGVGGPSAVHFEFPGRPDCVNHRPRILESAPAVHYRWVLLWSSSDHGRL
jgi:hypothetical protein